MTNGPTQQPFNPATLSFSGFDSLNGIDEPRKVEAREQSALERILNIESRLLTISNELSSVRVNFKIDDFAGNIFMYALLYNRLKDNELANVDFNEQDITDFVNIKVNSEYDTSEYDATKAVLVGLYSGVLLHLLTERNREKGKRTKIYVNGNGGTFPCLFSFAKLVDELVVINFVGKCLCNYLGSYGGNADFVCFAGNKSEYLARGTGFRGLVDLFMAVNNIGHKTGYGIAGFGGKANQIIIANHEGGYTCINLAEKKGYAGCVIINRNNGNRALEKSFQTKGTIELAVIMDNAIGEETVYTIGRDRDDMITTLVIDNPEQLGKSTKAKKIITGDDALSFYDSFKSKYPIETMVTLCQSLKTQSQEEALRLVSQVYALHKLNYNNIGLNVKINGK